VAGGEPALQNANGSSAITSRHGDVDTRAGTIDVNISAVR
jgi:hypothetical protein